MRNLLDHVNVPDDVPLLTADRVLQYRWRDSHAPKVSPPQAVIVCYQRGSIASLVKQHRAIRINGFFGDLQVLKTSGRSVGVMSPSGPGAPIAAVMLEELSAFGVERFISVGLAGSLQPDLRAGDVVVCDRAIRDEGTSNHYLPSARSVEAAPALTQQLSAMLAARGVAHSIGASWTTDAPYRETRREVTQYRGEGVKTVDMEAAALFAVGQALGVQTAAVFVVGDRLADLVWQPAADSRLLYPAMTAVAKAIIQWVSAE